MSRGYTVYAIDFDGTLCESVWPGIGAPNLALINHLRRKRQKGDKVILWTCRVGERLEEAVQWCRGRGLEFDAVNDNLPELIASFGNNCRKVAADVYIDDKAVNKAKYQVPFVDTCDRPVKITNAEKIRSMSDLELAEFLEGVMSGDIDIVGDCADSCVREKCTPCIAEWLRRQWEN